MLLYFAVAMLCWAPVEYPIYDLCWRYGGDVNWTCERTDARCVTDPAPSPQQGEWIEYRVDGTCE